MQIVRSTPAVVELKAKVPKSMEKIQLMSWATLMLRRDQFMAVLTPHSLADWAAAGGSAAAVLFGFGGYLAMQPHGVDYAGLASFLVGVAGIVTAFAGLLNSSLARILPFWKLYIDDRRADQEAKYERHELDSKLQAVLIELKTAHLLIERLQAKLAMHDNTLAKVEQSGEMRAVRIEEVGAQVKNMIDHPEQRHDG